MRNILVCTNNLQASKTIQSCLSKKYSVIQAKEKDNILKIFQQQKFDYLFIDISFLKSSPKTEYKQAFQQFWHICSETEIVVMTEADSIREAVDAVKAGAINYLTYPLNEKEIDHVIDSIEEQLLVYSELDYFRNRFWRSDSLSILHTNSNSMKEIYSKVRAVSPTDSTVLLTGETGTGKGVIARLIHQHSKRSDKQFISIHCGALPETLLESELFGHEKGAFTGAIRRKMGKFEIANGGTIFLDEIGTISATMQINLLQVLQEKTFQRVGGEITLFADVRIIAATNSNLEKMVAEGTFRQDLFYRLNVFPIEMPSLRERKEDIQILSDHFLKKLNKFSSKKITDFHPEVMNAFQVYDWPGNIRELENLIERAYILENSNTLTPKSFPVRLFHEQIPEYFQTIDTSLSLEEIRKKEIEKIEQQYFAELLKRHNGKINSTADAAGIGVRQLHKLLKKYNIKKEDFK